MIELSQEQMDLIMEALRLAMKMIQRTSELNEETVSQNERLMAVIQQQDVVIEALMQRALSTDFSAN
jgi:hypothetical protein